MNGVFSIDDNVTYVAYADDISKFLPRPSIHYLILHENEVLLALNNWREGNILSINANNTEAFIADIQLFSLADSLYCRKICHPANQNY